MDTINGQSYQIGRMNPNHPILRQCQIYDNPDDIYNLESDNNDSDHMSSSGSSDKCNKENLHVYNEDSAPKCSSIIDNYFKNSLVDIETLPSKLTTCVKLSKMIHILEGTDKGNALILESRSSHGSFKFNNNETSDTVHIKTPTPIRVRIIEDAKKDIPAPPTRMDWYSYHRLEVIHNFLDDLECDYPSICTAGVIGKSVEGRDIKILKISNSRTTNPCVWIDAGIHAREWIAPAVATYIANHIATNFDTLPESITNKDWYFLPVVNPDGYEYTHTVDRMWRKNRAWHAGECVGVDLNRNFSFGWGGKGSSGLPSNAFYRGPEAFSEPESAAMRDMLINSGISFKVYITLHSYGQVIIFPFAFKEELCPDYVRLLEGATVMSKAIHETNGNTYKVGISRDVMYGAAGTSNDWSYGEAGIPFCYLIELRSKKHRFKLPQEEIEDTGNEILNCVKALMEYVDK